MTTTLPELWSAFEKEPENFECLNLISLEYKRLGCVDEAEFYRWCFEKKRRPKTDNLQNAYNIACDAWCSLSEEQRKQCWAFNQ